MSMLLRYYLIVLLLPGCTNAVTPIRNSSATIVGHWQLEAISNNEKVNSKPNLYTGSNQIQVFFQGDGNLLGNTSRNSLTGNYKADSVTIKINTNHSEIAESAWGTEFLNALPIVNKYAVSQDSLKLMYENDKQLIFVKVP